MSTSELAAHIAECSGNDRVQEIEDFEQWYADNFGGDDLSRLLPPRMVLVGLGVDPVAERMAKFISGGPVDLSVVTFHAFMRGEEKLLARQLDVMPQSRRPLTVKEKHEALRAYLTRSGYEALFDRIHDDIGECLSKHDVRKRPRKKGIGFKLTEPDGSGGWKSYFGVYAGYRGSAWSVSILPPAIDWGGEALTRLRTSVQLHTWPHVDGALVCDFQSEEEWAAHRGAVLEFVRFVIANRSSEGKPDS